MPFAPLADTVPFKVAPLDVIEEAAFVVAVGAMALVVKVWSSPSVVPAVLAPTTRK